MHDRYKNINKLMFTMHVLKIKFYRLCLGKRTYIPIYILTNEKLRLLTTFNIHIAIYPLYVSTCCEMKFIEVSIRLHSQ
jgi:hypothetical protein